MKKVLFLVPHLSTGGMPQYTYDLMRKIQNDVNVYCIEYSFISSHFVVQRNRIIDLLGERFICLGEDKNELFQVIQNIQPDIIHLQEVPEYFLDHSIASKLYSQNRNYLIIETSHDSSFPSSNKRFFPDHFALISEYQRNEFSKLGIPIDLIEADIEYKQRQERTEGLLKLGLDPNLKHIVNVGLFTPRKNQAEAIEYAKSLQNYPIQFHFVGNQADNFANYWKPLIQNLPSNVKIWGERSDVDDFYSCMDMMLFTSRGTGNDKETSPLVIRESIGYNLPSLIFNLPVYLGMYDKYDSVSYMDFDNKESNLELILNKLNIPSQKSKRVIGFASYDMTSNKISYSVSEDINDLIVSVRDIDSRAVIWSSRHEHIPANVEFWMIPVPKTFYDFETQENFGGFIVEFYSKDELLDSKSFRIKNVSVNKPITKVVNNTEPTFFNYNEFFVDKIYGKFLDGKTFETVVDVGANVGLWTEYIRTVADVNKIYLVEPNKTALQILNKTYGNDSDVSIAENAMSNFDGKLELFIDAENSLISSIVSKHKEDNFPQTSGKISVDSIRFDTFVKKYDIKKIDLMKVDIESAEYDLFDSMTEFDFSLIQNILVEYHLNDERVLDVDVKNIISRFEKFGFSCDLNIVHSTGGFIFATRNSQVNKKIKAVQFLLNGNFEKQNQSIENISKITEIGIEYVQHFNDVYVDLPPASKSNRPHDVSMELKPNSLTPAHYGCYDSFRTAVLSEFDSDLDYFIVMEGDAKIQDYDLFKSKLSEAIHLIDKHNLGFVSFGGIFDLEMGVLQSNVIEDLSEDFFVCDKIIGCQFLIFPASSRHLIKEILRNEKWDALDIYLNNISYKYGIRVGVSRKTLVTQYDGISTIDNVVKQFKEFSI